MSLGEHLPLLRADFFRAYSASADFWSKWQSAATWSEEFCPIYEWEQLIFIGCTSYQAQIPPQIQQRVILVLCEPEVLQKYYGHLLALALPAIPRSKPNPAQTLAATPPSNAPRNAPTDDPFAGLMAASESSQTSEDNGLLRSTSSDEDHNENDAAAAKVEPVEGLLDLSGPPPAPVTLSTKTEPPVAVESGANTAPPVAEDFTSQIFNRMRTHYIKSMLFRKEGNTLIPWKWDSDFNPQTATQESPIPVSQPSPFRIVAQTLKPYHGYLSPNEVAEKFFEDWNSSQIPDHITLVPIVIQEQMVGALLGIAEKSVNQKASLLLAENLATELESSLASQAGSLAAS